MKDIWVSLSGAIAQQRNVETIANNVANANTPGFKRDQMVFEEHLTVFQKGNDNIDLPNKEWSPNDFYKSNDSENAYVRAKSSFTIHEQGQLSPTGNPLDIGLHGKGLIEILTPNGVRYTRKGTLTLSNSGTLVTDQGLPVLSKVNLQDLKDKDPNNIVIPPPEQRLIKLPSGKVSFDLEGGIFVNGKKISDLSVVEFNDMHALRKEGSSMFINRDIKNILPSSNTRVHQGFMEESNVNAVSEMSALIKANRQFETIQNAIKAYDNITGKGVNEIARF